MNRRLYGAGIFIALSAAACQFFSPATTELTLVARNQSLNTEIAAIRSTATVEADRLMITLEGAQTAVNNVQGQSTELASTLVALGVSLVDMSNITPPAVATLPAAPEAIVVDAGALAVNAAPPPGAPTPVAVTPGVGGAASNAAALSSVNLTPVVPDVPNLSNIVMTDGVGSDDCALASRTTFNTTDPEIWVVATANNIAPGTTITARWLNGAQEMAAFDFTPDYAINGECIWFYVDQSNFAFTPGSWSVQMELNGVASGAPTPFIIEGEAIAQATP